MHALKIRTCRLAAVLAAAGLMATPAMAQTVEELTVTARIGPDGEPQALSRAVSFADLDLTTPEGKQALKRRIADTAFDLCRDLGESPLAVIPPLPSCQQSAINSTRKQLRQVYAEARPRSFAAYDTSSDVSDTAVDPITYEEAPAPETAPPASYTTRTITNGPVADTAENRARFGGPMSNAGQRTAPAGN
jgi:UrcA family protein